MVRAKSMAVVLFLALAGCATQQIPLPEQIGVSDKPIGGGGRNPEIPTDTCASSASASR